MSLDHFAAVSNPRLAKEQNLLVGEGRLVVERLLRAAGYSVDAVLVTETAREALGPVLAETGAAPDVHVVPHADFRRLTGYHLHQGCVAIAKRPLPLAVADVAKGGRTLLLLDGVADPSNLGALFRNAAAFDIDAVVLSPDSADPYYRKAIRVSMGATLTVPFARSTRWAADLAELSGSRFRIVAFSPRATVDLSELELDSAVEGIALAFGAEGRGTSPELEAVSDCRVRIPISAAVDSLNVAVASGIALAQLRRHTSMRR